MEKEKLQLRVVKCVPVPKGPTLREVIGGGPRPGEHQYCEYKHEDGKIWRITHDGRFITVDVPHTYCFKPITGDRRPVTTGRVILTSVHDVIIVPSFKGDRVVQSSEGKSIIQPYEVESMYSIEIKDVLAGMIDGEQLMIKEQNLHLTAEIGQLSFECTRFLWVNNLFSVEALHFAVMDLCKFVSVVGQFLKQKEVVALAPTDAKKVLQLVTSALEAAFVDAEKGGISESEYIGRANLTTLAYMADENLAANLAATIGPLGVCQTDNPLKELKGVALTKEEMQRARAEYYVFKQVLQFPGDPSVFVGNMHVAITLSQNDTNLFFMNNIQFIEKNLPSIIEHIKSMQNPPRPQTSAVEKELHKAKTEVGHLTTRLTNMEVEKDRLAAQDISNKSVIETLTDQIRKHIDERDEAEQKLHEAEKKLQEAEKQTPTDASDELRAALAAAQAEIDALKAKEKALKDKNVEFANYGSACKVQRDAAKRQADELRLAAEESNKTIAALRLAAEESAKEIAALKEPKLVSTPDSDESQPFVSTEVSKQ